MASDSTSAPGVRSADYRFRCISCGDLSDAAAPEFPLRAVRRSIGDHISRTGKNLRPDAAQLKAAWRDRRLSSNAVDQSGVWRFRDLLPAIEDDQQAITLREGNTPLYELPRCSRITGVPQSVREASGDESDGLVQRCRHDGRRDICAARRIPLGRVRLDREYFGLDGRLRCPWRYARAWCSFPKARFHGANFLRRSTTARSLASCALTSTDACDCCRNSSCALRFISSIRSILFDWRARRRSRFELLEQLDWQVPDHIIVPGGNLGNSSAIGKALVEMRELGLISRLPKLSVIQAEGANALVRTLREAAGKQLISVPAETRATAIRIGNPASWKKAVHVLEATEGACEQVTEVEIAQAKAEIGAEGIGCEPASAVTLAGLKKLVKQGFVKPDETVVLVLTGNLLKDPDFTIDFHRGEMFKGTRRVRERSAHCAAAPPIVLDANAGRGNPRHLEQAEKILSGTMPSKTRNREPLPPLASRDFRQSWPGLRRGCAGDGFPHQDRCSRSRRIFDRRHWP